MMDGGDLVIYVVVSALALLAAFALWSFLKVKKKLARERLAFESFRARYPQTFLDADAEVVRLGREKSDLDSIILATREQGRLERERETARVIELRSHLERELTAKRSDWEGKFSLAMQELQRLQGEVEGLNEEAEIQSYGLYKPRYEFARAEEFKVQLDRIRQDQKRVLKNKGAATCLTRWDVRGSAAEGRRMVDRQIKLMLIAFNGECEAATSNVTWKNIVALRQRIRKSFENINKLGETVQCQITMDFLKLRLDELDIAYEYAEKVHAEQEEQRELREQMRDEEKARIELEREKDEAEREGVVTKKALEKARAEVALANQSERAALDAKIAKLEALLAKAEARKQRAISQAELTKLGHVYILSNEGSFGANVFKIGMTRRLEPLDRVDELGSASVPFRFDVHAVIRSDDAPALEQKLHLALEPHRINLVNHRKEYFRVPLEKIADLVAQYYGKFEVARVAEASEYRKSLSIRAEREAMVAGKVAHATAVTRADQVKARYEELKKATAWAEDADIAPPDKLPAGGVR